MGRNIERDEREHAIRMKKIAATAFSVFAEHTIEKVTMSDIADACGKGVASIYRHYSTKPALVVAASTWAWENYLNEHSPRDIPTGMTAAERFGFFLDSFLDLYHHHKDLLRFNQFFNVYVQSERISQEQMTPYMDMIGGLVDQFHEIYVQGQEDGTLRTDLPEGEMVSTVIHLMLAAVTRYAVGLVYNEHTDPEKELQLLRDLLLTRFTAGGASQEKE